jgi:1-acyl-sn-glycerol-3-phosphate acyltransferase
MTGEKSCHATSVQKPFYRLVAKVVTYLGYKVTFSGFDSIPKEGPAFLVSNHVSFVDGIIIAAGCNRPIRFVIEEEIYDVPAIKWCMDHYCAPIPISPSVSSTRHAIELVSQALDAGEIVCIFPEGKHTTGGEVSKFKQGIELMLKAHPAPVYPIAICGLWGSIFSKKYKGNRFRYMPRKLRRALTVRCSELPVAPTHATASFLEQKVRDLKEAR